ncbi:hypothetical protein [Lysobacter gummosus]|uniref:hypothetical protein n=1 Tax=Lysobacter gummosus TaxID=262324 RepID=UPI00364196ED
MAPRPADGMLAFCDRIPRADFRQPNCLIVAAGTDRRDRRSAASPPHPAMHTCDRREPGAGSRSFSTKERAGP